jgi:hypothetical protein
MFTVERRGNEKTEERSGQRVSGEAKSDILEAIAEDSD